MTFVSRICDTLLRRSRTPRMYKKYPRAKRYCLPLSGVSTATASILRCLTHTLLRDFVLHCEPILPDSHAHTLLNCATPTTPFAATIQQPIFPATRCPLSPVLHHSTPPNRHYVGREGDVICAEFASQQVLTTSFGCCPRQILCRLRRRQFGQTYLEEFPRSEGSRAQGGNTANDTAHLPHAIYWNLYEENRKHEIQRPNDAQRALHTLPFLNLHERNPSNHLLQ